MKKAKHFLFDLIIRVLIDVIIVAVLYFIISKFYKFTTGISITNIVILIIMMLIGNYITQWFMNKVIYRK